ncbi:hypothetical protein [Streptomyces sp. NPDC056452]|uniref:hypothetical protein n=1 Tax=Streptomyces sp. NPDC056452 TaxID=3345821 RepID=UPI0036BF7C59
MFGAGYRRAGWRSAAAVGCAVVTLLGVTGCGDSGDGGNDKAGKSPAPSRSAAPALTEAELEAVAFTDGEKAGAYTANEYALDGPLGDGYTATPAVCQPLVSLAGDAGDHDPAAQVQRRVDVPDDMLGVMVDVTLRSYGNGEAAKVMQSLRKAGRDCAGGLMEERAIARARYVKVEPTGLPAFAGEADEASAYRFTILDVKDKVKLYEYLTVVRAGSTTLAFRGEILATKDIGGVPQDIMAAQWKKFRAGQA